MKLAILTAVVTSAVALAPVAATPALAARQGHHKHHSRAGTHGRANGSGKLSLQQANVVAKQSAEPLKQLPSDQVTVMGCSPATGGFSCAVKLVPTASTTTCLFDVLVGVVGGVGDAKQYSPVVCR